MIFVTVGAQMPFDRLIEAMDTWAAAHPEMQVVAQIGTTDYEPQHMEWSRLLDPAVFRERMSSAQVIVAHAGMGTILTALELGKPILVMPRRGDLRETRNDHQMATAQRFDKLGRVATATDPEQLGEQLARLADRAAEEPISNRASDTLIDALRRFVARD